MIAVGIFLQRGGNARRLQRGIHRAAVFNEHMMIVLRMNQYRGRCLGRDLRLIRKARKQCGIGMRTEKMQPAGGVGKFLFHINDGINQHGEIMTAAQAGKLNTLTAALATPAAASGTNSVKADWDHYMNSETFFPNYPATLPVGLETFERRVSCNPSF